MPEMPLHPAVVHLPLGLATILPILALAILLGVRRQVFTPKTWALVLALHGAVTVFALVGTRTGEDAAEAAETRVTRERIREHEDAAELFMVLSVGVTALAALGLADGRLGRTCSALTVAAGLVLAVVGVRAGHLGGELVYVHGAAGGPVGAPPVAVPPAVSREAPVP